MVSTVCTTPWMFPPLDILLEYWIEHVTLGLLYVMFTLPVICYKGVPGFAIDCSCGIWCRGLTACLLYVGPLFGNLARQVSFHYRICLTLIFGNSPFNSRRLVIFCILISFDELLSIQRVMIYCLTYCVRFTKYIAIRWPSLFLNRSRSIRHY